MAIFAKLKERLKGVREKWSGGIAKLFSSGKIEPQFWDDLEEQLIMGDAGLDFTEETIDFLKAEAKKKTPAELRELFTRRVIDELRAVDGTGQPFTVKAKPLVLLMIGVNGSGKTTSAVRAKP